MSTEVVVLCWGAPGAAEGRIQKIVEFLGGKVSFVSLAATLSDVDSTTRMLPSRACLIADAETMAAATTARDNAVEGLRVVLDSARHVFIHGFRPGDRHNAIVRTLSSGGCLGVQRPQTPGATFRVADGHREWCGQFSGLSLGTTDPRFDVAFIEGAEQHRQAVLIRAGDRPFFVRVPYGRCEIFLLASHEIADLDTKVPGETGLLPWFSRLVPLMMFLRGALGERVWHNDRPRACFIIDDPLLKRRYGFLEYPGLFASTRRKQFSVCIAFIPWNFRRSQEEVAAFFRARPRSLSVCVHGCDHTGAEFGAEDFQSLCGKAQLALARMRMHRRLSGVQFDEIMIFPQGVFSSDALRALRTCGYLAAVNTDLVPSNAAEPLTLRDCLDVAVTKFAAFPLFARHYPKDLAEFAFDLFLGKPALAVEHHGYFRTGYEQLEAFVSHLTTLDERLEWSTLTDVCSGASLTRLAENGDFYVRFYTDRFSLTNRSAQRQTYVLVQARASESATPSVTVNRRHWACKQENDHIELALSLNPEETADIRVLPLTRKPLAPRRTSSQLHNVRVLVRRLLSEFRDNHVDNSQILRAITSRT